MPNRHRCKHASLPPVLLLASSMQRHSTSTIFICLCIFYRIWALATRQRVHRRIPYLSTAGWADEHQEETRSPPLHGTIEKHWRQRPGEHGIPPDSQLWPKLHIENKRDRQCLFSLAGTERTLWYFDSFRDLTAGDYLRNSCRGAEGPSG